MANIIEMNPGETYFVLPLRDIVVFPHMIVPLFVGRDSSIAAIEKAMSEDKSIVLVTQKEASVDVPSPKDFYPIGTLATILQVLRLPDGTVKALVEGKERLNLLGFMKTAEKEPLQAFIHFLPSVITEEGNLSALMRIVLDDFEQYIKANKKMPPEILSSLTHMEDPSKFADVIAGYLTLKVKDKQELLETSQVKKRLELLSRFIEAEITSLQVEQRIRNRIKRQVEKSQREYFLTEQMKAIQKELGEGEEGKNEFDKLEERIEKTKLSKEAREKAKTELKRLRTMSPMAAEANILRTYLEWLLDVPWNKRSKVVIDLEKAKKILDKEHYGLDKVKERILEFLAVQKRVGKVSGQILCFVGPPGVGKTSLGKSISKATGRHFVRMSLGGVRDEAEIRGHRRTYIGALPGRVIQGMKKAETTNPLFLLDEIDKLGSDWRGDPSSALLEVLDPEQNNTFNDHYLEVDYDLSEVMFVTTANTLDLPQPLLDRMEIIRLHGYTEEEKMEIAKRHLLPRQKEKHALKGKEFEITDKALLELIRYYTKEAGVRSLEREIATLARKAVKEIVGNKATHVRITPKHLDDMLGVRRYRFGETEAENLIGITSGLAWTEVGGELLTVEALKTPGKGKVLSTGKLGEVMQESVQAAVSYMRARSKEFGIDPALFETIDLHIHVPEGAVPKDGPSAGVTICTSLVSLLTGIPVRRDVAMTGEITLRGRILPIGGLKEKLLAAQRAGIKMVILPEENRKDIRDVPSSVQKDIELVFVESMESVLKNALERSPFVTFDPKKENGIQIPPKEGLEKSSSLPH